MPVFDKAGCGWFPAVRNGLLLLALICTLGACGGSKVEVSLDPERFILTARIPDDLKLELAAKEPNVISPVSMTFDADGRLYVVEMIDYPTGVGDGASPAGRVRLLEDNNLDGFYEKATVFAESLRYPTSVLAWRDGVLVTRPPDILYLKDTNGDGKADVEQVLFTGFVAGNTQRNVNSLIWGLDNWIYGANGGNDGTVRSTKGSGGTVSLERTDFRFRPESGDIQPSYESAGGFGIAMDSWGRMFGCHGVVHIQHMLVRTEYTAGKLNSSFPYTRDHISDHEDAARLYPISVPETRFNHPEQAGRFSGASGLTFYGGGALPAAYNDSFFVADVAANLVHQDVLSPDGPSFKARRHPERMEFLAGKDNWFRPVNLSTGPDGALYLLDMHRGVIEHPEWVPEVIRQKLDLRAGDTKGRIYRLVPRTGLKPARPRLSSGSLETLVGALSNPNKWWRDTGQRLLVERQDLGAAPMLIQAFGASREAVTRVHALWTLEGLNALTTELILTALADPHPGVRENALRLAESRVAQAPALRNAVLGMKRDADPRVRFQLCLTLSKVYDAGKNEALRDILSQDVDNRWTRTAALAAVNKPDRTLRSLLLPGARFTSELTEGRRDFLRRLAGLATARGSYKEVPELIRLAARSPMRIEWRTALLDGVADALERTDQMAGSQGEARSALEPLVDSRSAALARAAMRVASCLGMRDSPVWKRSMALASRRAADPVQPQAERIEAVETLALGDYAQSGESLVKLLDPREAPEIQLAAARALQKLPDQALGKELLGRWRQLNPAVRVIAVDILLQRTSKQDLLIAALEKREIDLSELNLNLEQRRLLLHHSTDGIRRRAAALLGEQEFSNRKPIVDQYLPKVLSLHGDAAKGEVHFRALCGKCHEVRGIGTPVGADLSMAFAKGGEDLLTSILDPSASIAPEYVNYLVETAAGDSFNGVIKSESQAGITLVRATGEQNTVLRRDIRRMRADRLSLMPEGLEQGLRYQDLADLLAFLQQPPR